VTENLAAVDVKRVLNLIREGMAWIVMARFSCRPSGDIHAYTSPISACGLATVAGESKWSEARAIAARAAKRTNATRILILNTSVNLRLESADAGYRIVLDADCDHD